MGQRHKEGMLGPGDKPPEKRTAWISPYWTYLITILLESISKRSRGLIP
jgi:hypothetical protein